MTRSKKHRRPAVPRRGLQVLVAASTLLSAAHAQEVLRSYADAWPSPPGMGPIDWIGDIDGDGFGDLLIGDPGLGADANQLVGRVAVLSGSTGEVLHTYVGEFHQGRLGSGVAGLGDVTGDGIPDFMASTLQPSLRSLVWSGADGSLVAEVAMYFGAADVLGDLNGDGITDFVFAYPVFLGSGRAAVFHGGAFSERYSLDPPPETFAHNYGQAVASLGDVNGDGLFDFAVSAPGDSIDTICAYGEVFAYSGADGTPLWSVIDDRLDTLFGGKLAATGDLDGDGIGDLAVGARNWGGPACGIRGPGRVRFFSGRTGAELGVFDARPGWDFLSLGLVSVGDLDGNGYGDVLASFEERSTGPTMRHNGVVAIDGRTREQIYRVPNPREGVCPSFGFPIMSAAGDVNGDDFPDYLIASGCFGDPRARIDLFSGAPDGVRSRGDPCGVASAGKLPRIGVTGVPIRGSSLPVHLSRVAPDRPALLLAGQRVIRSSRGAGCQLVVKPFAVKLARTDKIRPGQGVATIEIAIPADPALVNAVFYVQWVNPDPAGIWRTTRVLEIEVQDDSHRRRP